jgi:hypothetical protein
MCLSCPVPVQMCMSVLSSDVRHPTVRFEHCKLICNEFINYLNPASIEILFDRREGVGSHKTCNLNALCDVSLSVRPNFAYLRQE